MSDVAQALGKITAIAGTPARITGNQSDPTARYQCHAIMVEALPTNSGNIYIMDRANGNKTTMVGVLAILAVPTANIIPTYTVGFSGAPNPMNAASYYIDVDNTGEGGIVSVLVI